MIKINIRNNFPAVAAKLDRLPGEVGNRAMVRALNATVEQGRAEMARGISREFMLGVSQVKSRLAIRKASARGGVLRFEALLEATRRGKGRSMNMIAFVEKSVSLAERRRRSKSGNGSARQLRFQIKRGGGKKMVKGAFIANKGRTVFIREGKARLPIKALNTIDVPQMFNTRRINSVVREVMLKRFDINFKRELGAVLRGFAR